MRKRLTPVQEEFLRKLMDQGGVMPWNHIDGYWRGIATRAQKKGLVSFSPAPITNGGQRVDITESGREALSV